MKVRITHPDVVHDIGEEVEVSDERGQRLIDIGYAEAVDAPEQAEAPAKSATKPDWVEYAVANGMDRDDAEAMTKAQLMDTYGDV